MKRSPVQFSPAPANRWERRFVYSATFLALLFAASRCQAGGIFAAPYAGKVELDVQSEYSHIRIRRQGNVRTMIFVRDNGVEAWETQIDFGKPHDLRFPYTQFMFTSYIFRPRQESVLIVGLGGGAMVKFLQHYDPEVRVDAVEIDPVVVKLADEYFATRSDGNVNIVTADGLEYLANTKTQYDVVYMDAFLKPSRDTDSTGVPLQLQTVRFYQGIQSKLKPGGLVVFNLNPHADLDGDIKTIAEAFPQVYEFQILGSQGKVVVASTSPEREDVRGLYNRAQELDRRFRTSFSFQYLMRGLKR